MISFLVIPLHEVMHRNSNPCEFLQRQKKKKRESESERERSLELEKYVATNIKAPGTLHTTLAKHRSSNQSKAKPLTILIIILITTRMITPAASNMTDPGRDQRGTAVSLTMNMTPGTPLVRPDN